MATRVSFIVTELGENVEPFMLHIYADVAEQERRAIAPRTKAALTVAKARGVVLGSRDIAAVRAKSTANANDRAAAVLPVIKCIQAGGAVTLRAIAAKLNARNLTTARGGAWTAVAVQRVLARR